MLGIALLAVVAELIARLLGIGDPALFVKHPAVEYMYKPSQQVKRLGMRFETNEFGMRSGPVTQGRQGPEVRVMVFGDSVLNGGAMIDQNDLATQILESALESSIGEDVVVGNISADSWGPGNWLAYAEEFGFFSADIVVLVLSSHDYADNPTYKPINPRNYPMKQPVSAMYYGIRKYLSQYLPGLSGAKNQARKFDPYQEASPDRVERALADLESFLKAAQRSADYVLVVQHFELPELVSGRPYPGHEQIGRLCDSLSITRVSLAQGLSGALRHGAAPYKDRIHLNATGQRILADLLTVSLLDRLKTGKKLN